MDHDLIMYKFSRDKVERGDFTHFLSLYGLDALPEGQPLRDLMNRFVFCIEGWDGDRREIHMISEIRRFYSAFHEAWPYWFYFCNFEVDTLLAMTLCCLPEVSTMQVDGRTLVKATCDPRDLLRFIKRNFMPMNLMCERAQISERGIFDRSKQVFEYFKFPFDEEPPPADFRPPRHAAPPSDFRQQKVGRNDPCPCGSGKKFKKCCGQG